LFEPPCRQCIGQGKQTQGRAQAMPGNIEVGIMPKFWLQPGEGVGATALIDVKKPFMNLASIL
jgi:hypothetical protein